ncbi:MAG: hypothetical protein IPK74_05240 [Deltaproteobacteria bacterium]|nr:hypothetical protein [Deltaproteobacteria bacterium]
MVIGKGLIGLCVMLGTGGASPPELPDSGTTPTVSQPAVTATTEPAAEVESTAAASPAEPAPRAAEPADTPVVASAATDGDARPPEASTRARGDGPRRNVRRGEPGDWGMQFTFGGLAPLSIAGIRDHGINRLLMTELGFRRVTKPLIVQFSLGAGVFNHSPREGESENDAGISASLALLRPFRVWRRISPYAGGMLHFHYVDPDGRANWMFNFSFGPVIGTEFYIGDRVSLLFQGQADLGITAFHGLMQVRAATSISAGGQTGLIFYF